MSQDVVIATMLRKSFSNVALSDSDDAIATAPNDVNAVIARISEIESL